MSDRAPTPFSSSTAPAGTRAAGCVPDNLSLVFLPPYSPELNPVEELWHELRRRYFANRIIDTVEQLIDACCEALECCTRPTRNSRLVCC